MQDELETLSTGFLTGLLLVGVVLAWGLVASAMSIRNAKGPRERRFAFKVCAGMWGLVFMFLFLMNQLAPLYRYLLLAVYVILFPALVYRWANMCQHIRHIDQREKRAEESLS